MTSNGLKDIVRSAVQVSKDHQFALKVYTERLEAELETVDKLLSAAEHDEDEPHLDIAGCIQVTGASKPSGLLSTTELLAEDSPFYADSARRQRFLGLTEYHPMRPKELESLTEAVRVENRRLLAYEAQKRGERPFLSQYSMEDLESTEGLDWRRIADKVVADSCAISQRSAKECEIRWLGDRHPRFNHSAWDESEVAAAQKLVEGRDCEGGDVDWVSIAEQLGTRRTPIDVMRHVVVRKMHVWDAESDRRLCDAVKKYGTECWSLVARAVSEDAQINSCQNRWYRTLDPSIRRGNWTAEEDAQLRLAVDLYGHAWVEVASVIPGRNNEQCRDRWTERLNPKIPRGKWSAEEDKRLISAVDELGVGKWKEVSERVGTGRTDNTCRYRYDFLKGPSSSETSRAASEAQVKNATVGSTSKPKQRTRKGKGRDVSLPTAPSAEVEDAPQESQTRKRGGNHTQKRKKDSTIAATGQPEVAPQPHPVQPPKGPRPRARRLNKDGTQTSLNPVSQNDSQVQPAVPEPAASSAIGSPHASPSEDQDTTDDAAPQLARKRRHTASRDELNSGNKKRKTQDRRRATSTKEKPSSQDADIVAKASCTVDVDPALGDDATEEQLATVVETSTTNPEVRPRRKSQPSRRKPVATPIRVQLRRSTRV
ncbi:hypothetical protein EI94DRAFT_1728203 [Lactarius quietus]|nr:hypothetical protein EI94DRAFT_1728203 [Lactarius quietus]